MHIIAKRKLREFWARHPEAERPLIQWHTVLEKSTPRNFAELKALLGSIDWAAGYVIFDIGGNKYRLVTDVVFHSQTVFIKHIMTHAEYDQWKP